MLAKFSTRSLKAIRDRHTVLLSRVELSPVVITSQSPVKRGKVCSGRPVLFIVLRFHPETGDGEFSLEA
jgi:hypothetical protein